MSEPINKQQAARDNEICWDCDFRRTGKCLLSFEPDGKSASGCSLKYTNSHVEYGDAPLTRKALREYLGGKRRCN